MNNNVDLKRQIDEAGLRMDNPDNQLSETKGCPAKGICNMETGYQSGPCPGTCLTGACVDCTKCTTECVTTCTGCVKCTNSCTLNVN